jgi:hypothetical protein
VFVAASIRLYQVRRQEDHLVSERLDFSTPVVSRATSLQKHGGLRSLHEKPKKSRTSDSVLFGNSTGLVRDGDFENVLSKVDGDDRILHFGSSVDWRNP